MKSNQTNDIGSGVTSWQSNRRFSGASVHHSAFLGCCVLAVQGRVPLSKFYGHLDWDVAGMGCSFPTENESNAQNHWVAFHMFLSLALENDGFHGWTAKKTCEMINGAISFQTIIRHMGVSKNSGTPKSSILTGFSIINHPFWGTPIFGNTPIYTRFQTVQFLPNDILSLAFSEDPPSISSFFRGAIQTPIDYKPTRLHVKPWNGGFRNIMGIYWHLPNVITPKKIGGALIAGKLQSSLFSASLHPGRLTWNL